MFDIKSAAIAQKNLCEENKCPLFAPESGRCWNCGQNIYTEISYDCFSTGISVEKAEISHITRCPHCHISFCD